MLQVTQFYVRSFDLDCVNIFWEIADFVGDIHRYTFQILRSESSSGPWDALTPEFEDQYYFRDISPALLHKWRTLYYLLRIRDKQLNVTQDFGPSSQQPEPDLIALEIMRQEDILFREHVGRRCWVFPIRTFGAKCTCFDRVTGRRTRSGCITCYDTGYLGGFLSPVECFVQIDPSTNSPSITPYGEMQPQNCSGRLISFPPLKPKDILVEAENRRMRVIAVTPTQRLRSVVHQEIQLHEIPKGDIEYKLPINIGDLTQLTLASERNFSNPQHVDTDDDLTSLMAVYGNQPRGSTR